ncbi:MAG: helicase-exonuclease AddAB subunit AddA [Roseburia sp.]|nr:helicase-exonuclease AddAB subunit AddA [Roseburia sp.]
MNWTDDQKKVITLRDRNILVSAAAGSGKTAVLVERIIGRILDKEHPLDIDRMLIVTFTNAAAAEMRERIREAIESGLEKEPFNVNLQKQSSLVHHAQITTIHSFCLYLIRSYFHQIDLEPDFRIGEEGELNLLREDVLSELLNENYEIGEESFFRFVETFATGKKDDMLHDLILKLYHFANSHPWPLEWLSDLGKPYGMIGKEELCESLWMKKAMEYLGFLFLDLKAKAEENVRLTMMEDGPGYAREAAESDRDKVEGLWACKSYEDLGKRIASLSFDRLPSKKGYQGSEEKLDLFKENRDGIKACIKKVKEQFFFGDMDVILQRIWDMQPVMEELLRLVSAFMEKYDAKKREKNVLDFDDLEHFALKILIREEDKELREAARECQHLFEEVMVDEYQDSNLIQEEILRAVSRESMGECNRFMVGDVKQSIYRFRLARPEIFMEKYDRYTKEDSKNQKIELHQNFRSRQEVLDCTNDIFYRIMGKDLGNVAYDEDAALNPGAVYPPVEGMEPELLLADEEEEFLKEAGIRDAIWLEAEVVAAKIRKLMQVQKIVDKATGELRNLKYSDIVILLRSFGAYGDTFLEVLSQRGIPAHVSSKTGYFQTQEILTILNFLRVLDNPRQDLPLAAVLRSPMGGFSDEELAKIKTAGKGRAFHLCFLYPHEEKLPEDLFSKINHMKEKIDYFRDLVTELPVHELLYRILRETGYFCYVMSMPGGVRRKANIEMLLEKALAYESTSYKGLFHFIRYMDRLQKYEVDYGEAEVVSENANAVRIMTIHKSKGLEFPVVFLSGTGKNFNRQDSRSALVIHPELGAALDYINPASRVKAASLYKKVVAKQLDLENQGEELRVLYVALTRAKEKLIITGIRKDAEKEIEKIRLKRELELSNNGSMSFLDRAGADCYLDWILPVMAGSVKYPVEIWGVEKLVMDETEKQLDETAGFELLLEHRDFADEWADKLVEEKLSYRYPYELEVNRKGKYSVSELKHRAMDNMAEQQEVDFSTPLFPEETIVPYIPAFMSGEKEVNQGALRGSAMHRAVECLPIEILSGNPRLRKVLEEEIGKILEDGHLPPEMEELIRREKLIKFYQSNLAERMKQASLLGQLYRERPFVMGKPADKIENDGSGTMVLIQGIIDAFFVEEGEIVLLDYKTDVVDSREELVNRYKMQLDLYQEALEGKLNKRVKEKLIYSFYFDEVIVC